MSVVKPQFFIGTAASGSGKTTFTMGLLRVLKRRGIPFAAQLQNVRAVVRRSERNDNQQ